MSSMMCVDDGDVSFAAPSVSTSNPLLSTFRQLRSTLLGEAAAPAAPAEAQQEDLHQWCMTAIQTLTQIAPAVRRNAQSHDTSSVGLAAVGLQHQHASLVLQFLTSMLHLLQMQPNQNQIKIQTNDAHTFSSPAASSSSSSLFSSRPLLPFLYANLFKYCLNLQEYDAYYHLLVHMPQTFETQQTTTTSNIEANGDGENMKLEYLKRFVLELLREQRIDDIVHHYNWSFSWSPEPHAPSQPAGQKSVREEVEEMLWWHAKSSDMSDEVTSTTGSGSTGHYETLYAFLIASHRYVRAGQAALHYFYRLESEVASSGGLHSFLARRVQHAQRGRGRLGLQGGKHVHEVSVAETKSLTLAMLRSLLTRKMWSLRSVECALEKATPEEDPTTIFMLEGGGATAGIDANTDKDESDSPNRKRCRSTNDDAMSDGSGLMVGSSGSTSIVVELIDSHTLNKRFQLLLCQFDLVSALDSCRIELPPLDELIDPNMNLGFESIHHFVRSLMKYGLVDRAFQFVKQIYQTTNKEEEEEEEDDKQRITRQEEYDALQLELFSLLAVRVVKLTLAASAESAGDEVAHDESDTFPLRMEDSLQALELSGLGAPRRGVTSAACSQRTIAVRESTAVLRYLLSNHRTSDRARACEIVAEEYLKFGIDLPIWLVDEFTTFMKVGEDGDAEERREDGRFHMRVEPAQSQHDKTLQTFAFVSFMRLLLAYNQYPLLFDLTHRYMVWCSSRLAIGVDSAFQPFLVDVLDAFLYLQDEVELCDGTNKDVRDMQRQVSDWVTQLVSEAQKLKGATQRTTSTTKAHALPNNFKPVTTNLNSAPTPASSGSGGLFGSAPSGFGVGGFTSRLAPTNTAGSATGIPTQSMRFSLATPAATTQPPSTFASSFAPASTPLKSPFADADSVSATPSGFGFGFGTSTPAAAASTPFSFTQPNTATKPSPSNTAGIIFQAAFNKDATATSAATTTNSTPAFSFGGFQ